MFDRTYIALRLQTEKLWPHRMQPADPLLRHSSEPSVFDGLYATRSPALTLRHRVLRYAEAADTPGAGEVRTVPLVLRPARQLQQLRGVR